MSNAVPARILIVDDTTDDLNYLGYLLKKLGHDPLPCADAGAALEMLSQSRPDLIIVAADMEGDGGFQVCERALDMGAQASVPVLFACGMARPGDKTRALRSGGADYLNKPYLSDEVTARINAHLALGRAGSDLEREIGLRREAEETARQADQTLEKRLEERMAATAATMERDKQRLEERSNALAREKQQLAEQLAEAKAEREAAERSARDMQSALDALQMQQDMADPAEADQLRRERDESRARTEELTQELDQLRVELDSAMHSAEAERINARQRNAALADRARELENEALLLKEQLAEAQEAQRIPASLDPEQLDKARLEKERLEAEVERLKRRASEAEQERALVMARYKEMEQGLQDARTERGDAVAQCEDLRMQRDQLARQRDELARQRDGLSGQLEDLLTRGASDYTAAPAKGGDLSLAQAERAHLRRVLDMTNWVIEGDKGAAKVLGLKPSTLRFRMRKRGISRPN